MWLTPEVEMIASLSSLILYRVVCSLNYGSLRHQARTPTRNGSVDFSRPNLVVARQRGCQTGRTPLYVCRTECTDVLRLRHLQSRNFTLWTTTSLK
jgi:hypothetical protein